MGYGSKGWRIVEKNQERISALVMDMLTFSKEREPEMVDADLNDVVRDVLELLQVRAEQAGVTLVDARTLQIPLMHFDPEGLHRAILNVVSNAIDACEEQEHARVEVVTEFLADEQNLLRILVRDNGAGIAADQLPRIFNVFVSGKGNRGTGLGLAVSQKILQEHNGEIRVESEPGEGSQFFLELPAVRVDATGEIADLSGLSEGDVMPDSDLGGSLG